MGLEVATLALIGAGIGGAGAVYGSVEQRRATDDARREQRKVTALEMKRKSLEQAKQRRAQIREAQVQSAQIEASAAGTGTARTSGVAQGTGSLRSRAAANISFLNQNESITEAQNIFSVNAGRFASDANRAASVSQAGQSLFSLSLPFTGGTGGGTPRGIEPNRPDSTFR